MPVPQADRQALLARLYTDAVWREDFLADPRRFADVHAGGDLELLRLDAGRLRQFARSLLWKRTHEAERLLPLTSRALDGRFADAFQAHAGRVHPRGIRKPLADALGFGDALRRRRDLSHDARQAARFEWLSLNVDFRLVRRPGSPASFEAVRRRGIWVRFSHFDYALPCLPEDGSAHTARRPTLVLFARVLGWRGTWYW